MILSKNYLEKLQKNQILNLAEFVVTENFKHHSDSNLPQDYKNDVKSIHEEEMNYYENSEVYTAKDSSGSILGAIRVLKWNYTDVLPLQKIFGINPLLAISQPSINNIYHIGRFAIKKDVRDINLFKQLMVCAIAPICMHKGNVAFAECDSKLLRILRLLGIKTKVIGESIDYLGSETIPIVMTYEGLINFYNENKHLAADTLNETLASYMLVNNNAENTIAYSA
jgi:N-acyl-L-homoserine lactone synthetase